MPTNSGKNQIIAFAVLMLALAVLITGANLISGKIFNNSRIVGEEIAKLDKKHLSSENLRDNLALVKEVNQQIQTYGQYFFIQGDEIKLITDLENIAAKNKMSQKILASNLDNYVNSRIDITINLTGPYANILKYLTDLEAYNHIIAIQKIEFQPTGFSVSNPNELSAIMRVQISLYANPKSAK